MDDIIGPSRDVKGIYSSLLKPLSCDLGIIKDRDWSLEIIEKLVRKHPSLRALTEMDDSCIVQVDITNFLYLDGVSDARYVSLSDD